MDILTCLQCLAPTISETSIRRLSRIVFGMLAMTGRVSMLGISRWAGKGGSYRTVQRFFSEDVPWGHMFWTFFEQHLYRSQDTYILAGDESVISKAGKHTYGLDRFFSGLVGKPVKSIAIFGLSLVNVNERRAYPVQVEQVVRSRAEKAAARARTKKRKAKPAPSRAKRGRPPGSKNRDKSQVALSPELLRIKNMVQKQLALLGGGIAIEYLALDGHFGNNPALQMVLQCGLHLISKLRYDAALYFPYEGSYSGRGPRKKYGDKIDYRNIPDRYLVATEIEGEIETRIYQVQLLHRDFAQALNVVIITKTNRASGAFANVNLFSSDLALCYDKLMDCYSLRFQIEFNFRDAKQYAGLEDFMNVKQTPLTNALNLSLFMVNLFQALLRDFRQTNPQAGVLDLKAYFRATKYFEETIKMLPQKPEPILLEQIFGNIASLGSIHPLNLSAFSP